MSPSKVTFGLCAWAFAGLAWCDPIPLLRVSVGGVDPPASAVSEAERALGDDALSGAALGRALETLLGPPVPTDDALAPVRAQAAAARELFFNRGGAAATPRLTAAVEAFERAGPRLALREDDRASYLATLALLGRIALEARRTAEANVWLRRAAGFDPSWRPSAQEYPPRVVQLFADLAGAQGEQSVEVRVHLPEERCEARLGAVLLGRGTEVQGHGPEGPSSLVVRCGDAVSRMRPVQLVRAVRGEVTVRPSLDAHLDASSGSLRYDALDAATVAADASAAGVALRAPRVVAVSSTRVWVLDALRGRVLAEGELSRVAALTPVARGAEVPVETTVPSTSAGPNPTRTTVSRGPGAGPWILVGAGALALGGAAAALVLRSGAVSDRDAACPQGRVDCPEGDPREATFNEATQRANQWTVIAGVGAGVGVLAVTGGLLWWALGRSRGAEPSTTVAWHPGGLSVVGRW